MPKKTVYNKNIIFNYVHNKIYDVCYYLLNTNDSNDINKYINIELQKITMDNDQDYITIIYGRPDIGIRNNYGYKYRFDVFLKNKQIYFYLSPGKQPFIHFKHIEHHDRTIVFNFWKKIKDIIYKNKTVKYGYFNRTKAIFDNSNNLFSNNATFVLYKKNKIECDKKLYLILNTNKINIYKNYIKYMINNHIYISYYHKKYNIINSKITINFEVFCSFTHNYNFVFFN